MANQSICVYCGKVVSKNARRCDACCERYPTGRPLYTFPLVIVAAVVCSAIAFWYLHAFTPLPGAVAILLAPIVAVLLIRLLFWLGD